jgi:predicted N-acetyltransferase YhbS
VSEAQTRPLTFRVATPADVPAIVALVEASFRGDVSRGGWTTEADLLDGQRTDAREVQEHMDNPRARFLLAFEGDTLVGSVLIKDDHGCGYGGMLSVSPVRQTAGLGSRLLAMAERALVDEFGLSEAAMTVIVQRHELIDYYTRRGWRVTDERRPFPYGQPQFGRPKRDDLEFVVLRKALV